MMAVSIELNPPPSPAPSYHSHWFQYMAHQHTLHHLHVLIRLSHEQSVIFSCVYSPNSAMSSEQCDVLLHVLTKLSHEQWAESDALLHVCTHQTRPWAVSRKQCSPACTHQTRLWIIILIWRNPTFLSLFLNTKLLPSTAVCPFIQYFLLLPSLSVFFVSLLLSSLRTWRRH